MRAYSLLAVVALAAACSRPVPEADPDTVIIRTEGLTFTIDPNAPPDSVSPPGCRPNGIAICVADTAEESVSSEDYGGPPMNYASWVVFASAADSLQIFANPADRIRLEMNKPGAPSSERTGRWVRFRFPRRATYVVNQSIMYYTLDALGREETSTAYELRLIPVVATRRTLITGQRARIEIQGPNKEQFVLFPAAWSATVDSSNIEDFAVIGYTRRYNVLLLADTAYIGCFLPCRDRKALVLKPGASLTVAP